MSKFINGIAKITLVKTDPLQCNDFCSSLLIGDLRDPYFWDPISYLVFSPDPEISGIGGIHRLDRKVYIPERPIPLYTRTTKSLI